MLKELEEVLIDQTKQYTNTAVVLHDAVSIGGGSINDAYRLETSQGNFFVKTNNADRHPSMFEAEADGLERLRNAKELLVPDVISFGEESDTTYLLLEWIEAGERTSSFWNDFGCRLAKLHRHTSRQFGLERDNYIGSLTQSNSERSEWSEFFVTQRLEPQVKMARDKDRIGGGDALRFEKLFSRMDKLFPMEPPALLHGDLWNGNFLTSSGGEPCIIDPAVYYGHREIDIAMSKLFGGFEKEFYSAYNSVHPMEQGWEERVDLCNLYPLMVHVNLFGGGYLLQAQEALKRFI